MHESDKKTKVGARVNHARARLRCIGLLMTAIVTAGYLSMVDTIPAAAVHDPPVTSARSAALAARVIQPKASAGTTLHGGDRLVAGQAVESPDGRYQLVMQDDGNLVLYVVASGHALWNSNTTGHGGALAMMQSDGNLVVYSSTYTALWDTRTGGNPQAYLSIQSDGNAVVYSPASRPLWATNTGQGGGSQGGACNAFSGAYALGTSYTDGSLTVPSCGPRPSSGGSTQMVLPYPGAPAGTPGYQCVEFVQRFMYYKYGVSERLGNGQRMVDAYGSAYPTRFAVIRNGTGSLPKPGDIIRESYSSNFNSNDAGHTAVVQSVDNGVVTIEQENATPNGQGALSYSGSTVTPGFGLNGQYRYIEWLTPR